MKYTDEEFFGNEQDTVNENGEVLPINNKKENEDLDAVGTIASTFVKTFVCLVVCFAYFVVLALSLFPKTAIKFYEFIGLNKTAVVGYEKVYQKSKELSDLYNLVQKSITAKDYERTNKYIKELQDSEGYSDFCNRVNYASISQTDLSHVVFVADLDCYLRAQKIISVYYTQGKKATRDMITLNLIDHTNLYAIDMYTYIELIQNDVNLSSEQKQEEYTRLNNYTIFYFEPYSIIDLMEQKFALLDVSISEPISLNENEKVEKLMQIYAGLKIKKVEYVLYSNQENQTKVDEVLGEITSLQNTYNKVVNA